MRIAATEIHKNKFLRIASSNNLQRCPRAFVTRVAPREPIARARTIRMCRKGGLERYGRSAHARRREHRRLGSDWRGEEYRFGYRRPARDGRRRCNRARRMHRELTNRTESRVSAELG